MISDHPVFLSNLHLVVGTPIPLPFLPDRLGAESRGFGDVLWGLRSDEAEGETEGQENGAEGSEDVNAYCSLGKHQSIIRRKE